jgi:hypothetical protein
MLFVDMSESSVSLLRKVSLMPASWAPGSVAAELQPARSRTSHVSQSSRTFIVSDKRSLSVEMIDRLSEQISQLNVEIASRARRDETSRRLMTIARSTLVQLIPIGRGQVDRYR